MPQQPIHIVHIERAPGGEFAVHFDNGSGFLCDHRFAFDRRRFLAAIARQFGARLAGCPDAAGWAAWLVATFADFGLEIDAPQVYAADTTIHGLAG